MLRKWTEQSLAAFFARYLAFHQSLAEEYKRRLTDKRPFTIYLDPLDAFQAKNLIQHALLAEIVVIADPLLALHCPAEPIQQWVTAARNAACILQNLAPLIERGFVHLVPDSKHCGVNHAALDRANRVLEDVNARSIWFEAGSICIGQNPGTVYWGNQTIKAPVYHLHLGNHFTTTMSWKDEPGMGKPPQVRVEIDGMAQKFDRASIKQGIVRYGLEKDIKKFFLPAIASYEASLLMARVWAQDTFSTLNPLTAAVLKRDINMYAKDVAENSTWIPPARVALTQLGIDTDSPERALDFREKHRPAFLRNIELMQELARAVEKIPGDSGFSLEVQRLVDSRIQPELRKLDSELRASAAQIKLNVGFLGVVGLGGLAVIMKDPSRISMAAGALGIGAISALGSVKTALSEIAKYREAKNNPMYFLWNARQHGLIRNGH